MSVFDTGRAVVALENIEQIAEAIRTLLSQGPYTSVHVYDGNLSVTDVHAGCHLWRVCTGGHAIHVHDEEGVTFIGGGASIFLERSAIRIEDRALAGTVIQRVYKLEIPPCPK